LGPSLPNGWDGWSAQRWARLDVLIYSLNQKIGGMQRALGSLVPHSKSYDQLKIQSGMMTPPGHEGPLTSAQIQALDKLTAALDQVAIAFQASASSYPNNPLPEPELRARSLL
jgi:hypothetical protein